MPADSLEETEISSTQLVDGLLLKVFRDKVRLPDGSDGIREWIDHLGASAVVPILPNGDTLLVRQYRYAAGREFLEVPAGKLDTESDTPEEIAAVELEEETGWKAKRLAHIGSAYPCIGYSSEIIHIFLAEGLIEGERDLDDGEFLETVRMPFEDALEKARSGKLADMKTVTALFYASSTLDGRRG